MASLQVRDFPEELYAELKVRAKQEHRSISQQAIIAIREHVAEGWERAKPIKVFPAKDDFARGETPNYLERRLKVLEEIHAMPKPYIPPDFPSTVELLHEAREER
jgi:plasmid stability protein